MGKNGTERAMVLNRAKLAGDFMIDWLTMMRTVEHELNKKGLFRKSTSNPFKNDSEI